MFMAEIWLGEKLSKLDYVATCIVSSGVILSAYFADKSEQCFTMPMLMELYVAPAFLIYGSLIVVVLIVLYLQVSKFDRIRETYGKNSKEYSRVIVKHRLFIPIFSSMVSKIQKAKESECNHVYGKHCSYRWSDFYWLVLILLSSL